MLTKNARTATNRTTGSVAVGGPQSALSRTMAVYRMGIDEE